MKQFKLAQSNYRVERRRRSPLNMPKEVGAAESYTMAQSCATNLRPRVNGICAQGECPASLPIRGRRLQKWSTLEYRFRIARMRAEIWIDGERVSC
jgi:hypothetical protein